METVTKKAVMQALLAQRERTLGLVRSLELKEWETIVLPGWRVRELVAHLICNDEGALTGRIFPVIFSRTNDGGLSTIEAWNDKQVKRWADRPVPSLIKGLETWAHRAVTAFKPVPEFLMNKKIPMGFGKVPLLYLGQIHTFDEYIHEQDLRRGLGRGAETDSVGVLAAARAMLEVAVQQTQMHLHLPNDATGTVVLRFDSGALPVLKADLAARTLSVGPQGSADATITGDAAAIMMVAARRDQWRGAEQSGALKIEGDRSRAEILLEVLRAV